MVLAVDVADTRDGRENVDWRGVWSQEVTVLIPVILGSTSLLPREARGLTPASLSVAPTGLALVAPFTQGFRPGLSYAAASRLELVRDLFDAFSQCSVLFDVMRYG